MLVLFLALFVRSLMRGMSSSNGADSRFDTHFGSRALEFAAMRNANLTVFADRNNGWNESP